MPPFPSQRLLYAQLRIARPAMTNSPPGRSRASSFQPLTRPGRSSFAAIRAKVRADLPAYRGTALAEEYRPACLRDDFFVHAIRHNEAFATSPEVGHICSTNDLYARARNARLIMSNTVPDMASPSVRPYCVWYPHIATEDTYREMVRRYPDMRYHAGRACAVAGYKTLYDELDLLPDISIAEEARDNGHTAIFDSVVGQPVRYAVMDDYTRSVHLQDPRSGACLNGDTAVRSSLRRHWCAAGDTDDASKKDFSLTHWPGHYFNIQEDSNVGTFHWPPPGSSTLQDDEVKLLHQPLPRDLPSINKDILILMAAWDGNIDRYARLRRPIKVPNEIAVVVRGAYHHTPFARWLDTCVDELFPCKSDRATVRQACHARFIMNDDLSRIDSEVDGEELPEFFWWPHIPAETTLRELAWRRPDLAHQVTLACIAGDYEELFRELSDGTKPTRQQWEAAVESPLESYRQILQERAKKQKPNLFPTSLGFDCNNVWDGRSRPWAWSRDYLRPTKELYTGSYGLTIPKKLYNTPDDHNEDWEDWDAPEDNLLNYHMHLQLGAWQRMISATDKARREAKASEKPIILYSMDEDRKRRAGPPPQPRYPKEFPEEED